MNRRHFISSTIALTADLARGSNRVKKFSNSLNGLRFKNELVTLIKNAGAYDVKIADPTKGFEHGITSRNPLTFFPKCKSVVAFILPNPAYSTGSDPRELKAYPYTHPLVMLLLNNIYRSAIGFLTRKGYDLYADFDSKPWTKQIQAKMCAYEAGIGSYGRSGLILHPDLGSRIAVFAFFTSAPMPPDIKSPDSCTECRSCEKTCPGGCFDGTKEYPESFSINKCQVTREAHKQKAGSDCQNCVDNCPVTKYTNNQSIRWLEYKYVATAIENHNEHMNSDYYELHQNHPNPFNATTTISYTLPEICRVELGIYDTLGQEIVTLVDKIQTKGHYTVQWDGMSRYGLQPSSGMYIIKMKADGFVKTRKILYVR